MGAHTFREGCSVGRVVAVDVVRPFSGGIVGEEGEGLRVWCGFGYTLKMVTWDDQVA